MSRTFLLVSCLVIGLLVLACGGPTNKNGAPTNSSSSSTAANTVPSGEQIGVPECDSFLNAYESCVSTKVPETQRAQFQTIMTNWRAEWKKLAADPQMKAGLITACKNHMETARTQMKAYNCTF
ncbi:MAG TPA: hypothetical protein VFY61_19255 [Pyrinomonadaceae bacterium]|nr:hypothetical protein [Pyrinomonadaceae bacterium]